MSEPRAKFHHSIVGQVSWGGYTLSSAGLLYLDGETKYTKLENRLHRVLHLLITMEGELVTIDALLAMLYVDPPKVRCVRDNTTIRVAISELRKIVGKHSIINITNRGYILRRFNSAEMSYFPLAEISSLLELEFEAGHAHARIIAEKIKSIIEGVNTK